MPLVTLQQFSSPPPGQRLRYEKGWTYVERRPGHRTELCRTIRSRAPSPEIILSPPPPPPSLEEQYHWHNYKCYYPAPEPIIIPRSPRPKPPPQAPLPAPTPPSPVPTTDPKTAADAAETARLRAQLVAMQEANEKRRRDDEEAKRKRAIKLLSSLPPHSEWERERAAKERQREREQRRQRERERDRARERDRQNELQRALDRARERERERDRQRERDRLWRDRQRRNRDPVRCPSSCSSTSCPFSYPFRPRYPSPCASPRSLAFRSASASDERDRCIGRRREDHGRCRGRGRHDERCIYTSCHDADVVERIPRRYAGY